MHTNTIRRLDNEVAAHFGTNRTHSAPHYVARADGEGLAPQERPALRAAGGRHFRRWLRILLRQQGIWWLRLPATASTLRVNTVKSVDHFNGINWKTCAVRVAGRRQACMLVHRTAAPSIRRGRSAVSPGGLLAFSGVNWPVVALLVLFVFFVFFFAA